MIENVAIVVNPRASGVAEVLEFLIGELRKYTQNIFLEKRSAGVLCAEHTSLHDISNNADIIVVLGGDGTMLLASDIGHKREIPLVGFHMGRLGFITPFYQDEIANVIKGVFENNLPLQERMRLNCVIKREGVSIYESTALNEVTLMKGGLAKMTYFDLFVDDTLIKNYRADGMIASTPTGSTGYSLSAGGPIVEPWMELMILTPICSHSMDSRDLIVSSESTVKIHLTEEQNDIYITKDGVTAVKMEYGDVLEIFKSKYKTRMYYSPKRTFFDHLKVKFGWGL